MNVATQKGGASQAGARGLNDWGRIGRVRTIADCGQLESRT
jgi:hypothetical protein